MNTPREMEIFSTIPPKHFHSCVLTTYSFDFNYFNHTAMPSIKRAGVRNISVFIDDSMLQQHLGSVSGFSATAAKKYSISGIVRKGAFHPKLNLFFGYNKTGFIIVGSGNLTASGHGTNHELWGAFHINGPDDPKAPLFKKAWKYIQSIGNETAGMSKRKIEWIETHTPWMQDIPDTGKTSAFDLGEDIKAYFLTNSENGIFNALQNIIQDDVVECTLISPFLDSKAAILFELEKLFPYTQIHMIVQPSTIACDLSKKDFSRIQFHNWDSIFPSKNQRYLHAKLMHLRTETSEYCLFGSANITAPAFGTKTKIPSNDEVCLLLERKSGDWLNDLGLAKKGENIKISEIERVSNRLNVTEKHCTYTHRLNAIDWIGNHLHVYSNIKELENNFFLVVFDGWGDEITRIEIRGGNYKKDQEFLDIVIETGLVNPLYAQLYEGENSPISNKQIIHDMIALSRTNPDPSYQKIEEILDHIEIGDAEMIEILNYLDPNDLATKKIGSSGGKNHDDKNDPGEDDGSGEVLPYNDFTKTARTVKYRGDMLYGIHAIERILETLRTIFYKLKIQDIDSEFQDEEADRDKIDFSEGRYDETAIKESPPQTRSGFLSLQNAVIRFFDKYIKILERQRKENHKPSVLDIAMFTIALHLLLDFYNKPIRITEKGHDEDHEKILMTTHGNFFAKDDYCRIVAEIIGKFTLLLINGIDDANDEYIRQRITKCKGMAYWHALCCIARLISDNDDNRKRDDLSGVWKWELGMNLRDQFAPDDADDEATAVEEIAHRMKIMHSDDALVLEAACKNFWLLIKKSYSQQNKLLNYKEEYPLKKERIAYYQYFGFAHIVSAEKKPSLNKYTIEVCRPGYPFSQDKKDFKNQRGFALKKNSLKYGKLMISHFSKKI